MSAYDPKRTFGLAQMPAFGLAQMPGLDQTETLFRT